jgi:hypothetical protein
MLYSVGASPRQRKMPNVHHPLRCHQSLEAVAILVMAVVFAAGCSGNGGSSSNSSTATPTPSVPPAPATTQPTFSDASVTGQYNLSAMFSSGIVNVDGESFTSVGTGTIVADGRGNFANGALTMTQTGFPQPANLTCAGGVFGTYNVTQNGTGTAQLEFTSFTEGNNGCLSTDADFTITLSNGGTKVSFASPGLSMTALLP